MVYFWTIYIKADGIESKPLKVKAVNAYTAVDRGVKWFAPKAKLVIIRAERGLIVKKLKCAICGGSYDEDEENQHIHTWKHTEAVKRQKQPGQQKIVFPVGEGEVIQEQERALRDNLERRGGAE